MSDGDNYWINPFEKNIVEDWRLEEFPQNYKDMISCFFPPEFMNIMKSVDVKPKILMGGRGTGKTHILRMISIQSIINRKLYEKKSELIQYTDYNEPYFGVYIKATLFTPLSESNVSFLDIDKLNILFEHLFNIQISIAIIDATRYLISKLEYPPIDIEKTICQEISKKYKDLFNDNTFDEILTTLDNQIKYIQKVIKEFPWHKDFSRYENKIFFTTAPDFILGIYSIIQKVVLNDKVLLIIIDEYDEFDEYQQILINKLIRSRTLSFRIGSKIGGIRTLSYSNTKELEEIHDYDPIIPLHFEISNDKRHSYRTLLKNIFIKRLSVYGEYKNNNPEIILPMPSLADEKLTKEELLEEFKLIREELKYKRKIHDPEKYWKNFDGHYKESAKYRILRKKGIEKIYAGFDEYVSLSSGIIRQYILLCRDAFNIAHERKHDIEAGEQIPITIQSEAAIKLSNSLLLDTIKTQQSSHGNKLVRLIHDLGRILEAKLYFSTEPQSNKIEIIDCQKFLEPKYSIPKQIVENGFKMPHFISETAFKPKQPWYSISTTSFSINNIFTPALKIPAEKRWSTPITVEEIFNICSNEKREFEIKNIITGIKSKDRIVRGGKISQETVSSQSTIYDNLDKPIFLSNCPITGSGCNRELINYDMQETQMKAFLAIPFNDGWIRDPRRWIKKNMTDEFQVTCKDTDDYSALGLILCKICSCIRQMPIGLFEITDLNPNVIFEFGMAIGLNKLIFILAFKQEISDLYRDSFPPNPFNGMEYVQYELSESSINTTIRNKIYPAIEKVVKDNGKNKCYIIDDFCPHQDEQVIPNSVLIALPEENNPEFASEVNATIKKYLSDYKVKYFESIKTQNDLCQLCNDIKKRSYCIIDTSYNHLGMLFALGVAFGRDKAFIQLHNTSLSGELPISDLRPWAIEYNNLEQLEMSLKSEIKKRFI